MAAATERCSIATSCYRRYDLAMTGSDHINEISIDELRRTLQERHGDKGLIGGEPMHHRGRRGLTGCQSLRQGAAHQRRQDRRSSMSIAPSAAARSSSESGEKR